MPDTKLFVTRPDLPPLEDFEPYLREIWASGQVTNGGDFHRRLEAALADYLGVPHVALFANGTLALLVALRVLDITGEVVTTPFSFVATAHALLWNGNRPVFADIDPQTLNLDPAAAEAAVTPRTRAILPVHVYGHPCACADLAAVADRHDLRLLYDAAHAFGVRLTGANLLRAGDLSVLSFHATKVFHTFEGGAIVCHDRATKARIDLLKNFGFRSETEVVELGINAKMNEFQAAFGLSQLARIDRAIEARQSLDRQYREALATIAGIRCLPAPTGVARHNHAYFPVLVEPPYPLDRDALYAHLRTTGIFSRRYFFPLICDFPMYRDAAGRERVPVARAIAAKVLCLPIHSQMTAAECGRVVEAIADGGRRRAG